MSDIYSLGVLIWEIVSRQVPWLNVSNDDIEMNIINGGRVPPLDVNEQVRSFFFSKYLFCFCLFFYILFVCLFYFWGFFLFFLFTCLFYVFGLFFVCLFACVFVFLVFFGLLEYFLPLFRFDGTFDA